MAAVLNYSDSVVVYRMEHSGCPVGDTHHGPHFTEQNHTVNGRYLPWFTESPYFGASGPTPQHDTPNLPVGPDLRCGCLRSQIAGWWSETPTLYRPEQWAFAVYKVSRRLAHIGERQVMFPKPPESIFLGYFPGWVNEIGELDDRWPDSAFLQPLSRAALPTPPESNQPPLYENPIDPLGAETILKGVGDGRSRLTFPSSGWIAGLSA